MTTKYIVRTENVINDWGQTRECDYSDYVDTLEEAMAIGNKIEVGGWVPNWVVVETTMDEKTFTITEEEVYNYEDDIAER
jgi:hypothetical protein